MVPLWRTPRSVVYFLGVEVILAVLLVKVYTSVPLGWNAVILNPLPSLVMFQFTCASHLGEYLPFSGAVVLFPVPEADTTYFILWSMA